MVRSSEWARKLSTVLFKRISSGSVSPYRGRGSLGNLFERKGLLDGASSLLSAALSDTKRIASVMMSSGADLIENFLEKAG
jgi:hypothetical protein